MKPIKSEINCKMLAKYEEAIYFELIVARIKQIFILQKVRELKESS